MSDSPKVTKQIRFEALARPVFLKAESDVTRGTCPSPDFWAWAIP